MNDTVQKEELPPEVATTFRVLALEHQLIWPDAKRPNTLDEYHQSVQDNGQAALCLSGGGIRSASFALGVVQALSRKGLLADFHYLSSVSGGGYLAGFLQRWMLEKSLDEEKTGGIEAEGEGADGEKAGSEAPQAGATGAEAAPAPKPAEKLVGPDGLMKALRQGCGPIGAKDGAAKRSGPEPTRVEPPQITALRRNSNFITPRVGMGSNDTWTAISISWRNIGVNWLLFVPLFLTVTLIPNGLATLIAWVGDSPSPYVIFVPLALSILCAMVSAWHVCRGMPSYRQGMPKVIAAGDGWLNARIVKWLVGWALFGTMVLWPELRHAPGEVEGFGWFDIVHTPLDWLNRGLGFTLISLFAALTTLVLSGLFLKHKDDRKAFRSDIGAWVAAFLVAALMIPLGCALFDALPAPTIHGWRLNFFATLGPLWLMASQLVIAFVFAATRRNRDVDTEADREWLARLSAVKLKPMVLWALLAFTGLLLFDIISWQFSAFDLSLTGLVGIGSGALAVFGGRAGSSGNTTNSLPARLMSRLPLQAIISIATFVFLLALLTLFGAMGRGLTRTTSAMIDELVTATGQSAYAPFVWAPTASKFDNYLAALGLIALFLLLAMWWFNKRIPVNRFSLNGMYRNRLSRAFLGGARHERSPDPFTGFDPKDNVELHMLAPRGEKGVVLYPVINVALNVTATENLAWQERKAEPFILTPLYCGSGMLAPEPALARYDAFGESERSRLDPPGVYVRSRGYAGSEPMAVVRERGITLATAISISGAAASPNMGYHSSAATAFMMTLFNVRLGQWMPNPARFATLGNDICLANPSSSLRALLRELGGQTDDMGKDIYLSDGGHFENLAVYEMIRRRCRYIVVSDAGADPNCDFADLGGLVRKAKIDFGADISFTKLRISSRGSPIKPQFAWATGEIDYGGGHKGTLLYVKPSFFDRDLPMDVVAYAKASESFPHESTGDQFFSESQFESYRKLGFTFAREIGGSANHDSIAAFFDALKPRDSNKAGTTRARRTKAKAAPA